MEKKSARRLDKLERKKRLGHPGMGKSMSTISLSNADQVWVMQRELTDEDRHKAWLQAGGISPSAKRKAQTASLLRENNNGKYDKCFYNCTDGLVARCKVRALVKVCYKADISQAKIFMQ